MMNQRGLYLAEKAWKNHLRFCETPEGTEAVRSCVVWIFGNDNFLRYAAFFPGADGLPLEAQAGDDPNKDGFVLKQVLLLDRHIGAQQAEGYSK